MPKKPLYQKIFQYFKDKIKSGEFKPGDQLPTEKETSQLFNVSRITVTRALKELQFEKFIHRIQGSGSYVNDGNWNKSENLSDNKSEAQIISLVLPFSNNFSSDFLRGIEDIAKEKDYFVTFHNSTDNPEREKKIINKIISFGSHGIILYPAATPKNMDLYTKILINKYPLVLIDKKIPGLDISLVCSDNKKDFYEITCHLLKLGHKRIIFVGTDVYNISSEYERYQGFCQAHIDNGIPLLGRDLYTKNDLSVVPSNYRPNEPVDRRACNYLFDLLENLDNEEKPTAIAAVNDYLAGLIISISLEREIDIPNTYSIVGFDNLPFTSHLQVPLTTIAQPIYEIGKMAAKELFEKIKSPEKPPKIHTINGKLIVRKSTKEIAN